MGFSSARRTRLLCFALALTALVAGNGCRRGETAADKASRAEIRRALREQSYAEAAGLAAQLVERAPQNSAAWEALLRAQLGLGDVVAAKATLQRWRRAVRAPSARLEELEGDVAMKSREPIAAVQFWAKASAVRPGNTRLLKKLA